MLWGVSCSGPFVHAGKRSRTAAVERESDASGFSLPLADERLLRCLRIERENVLPIVPLPGVPAELVLWQRCRGRAWDSNNWSGFPGLPIALADWLKGQCWPVELPRLNAPAPHSATKKSPKTASPKTSHVLHLRRKGQQRAGGLHFRSIHRLDRRLPGRNISGSSTLF